MRAKSAVELFAVSAFLFGFINLSGQKPSADSPEHGLAVQPPPVRNLDLTRGESLVGLPASTVIGYPQRCSSDGYIFLEVYADSSTPDVAHTPQIYRISSQREVKKIPLPLPSEYKVASSASFFASENALITLLQVSQPTDPTAPSRRGERIFFLSITDRDGGHQKLIKLNLGIDPAKAAMFSSGQILIVGSDTTNLEPVLALLKPDGTLDRRLDLDERPFDSSDDLHKLNKPKSSDSNTVARQHFVMSSLNKAVFTPWGDEILLVQPGSKLPIYRIHASGQIDPVSINIPGGNLINSIVGSGSADSWVVTARNPTTFQDFAKTGIIQNIQERIFEVDPLSGNVIDELSVKGPPPGEISCAANKKLSVVYYGNPLKENVPDELTYASAQR
jgi:hypothetical protein